MIPTKTDVEIEGSLPGESVMMSLDANSIEHLMGVLSNLYSNKTLAIVREYSTNALDSHIEAGIDRPIEVSTPSDFMPYFVVRDFGVGMDVEDIRNVYSRYGASTKRGTNSQNGMLGLGSKSALTYTTQFNITGVKNGIKTHVVVSRSANGSGEMKIVGTQNTNESNGVTIQIPVQDRRDIENVAHSFFRFWKPGTVLLNGKDPSKLEGQKLGRFIITDNMGSVDYIVMGNVAYPIPQDKRIFSYGYSRSSVIAFVEMGEVNFTPSRESLHMTELTKKALTLLKQEFTFEVKKHLIDKLDNAKDHNEALINLLQLKKTALAPYVEGLKYKGDDIPDHFIFDWIYYMAAGSVYEGSWVDVNKIYNNKCIIIHDYDYDKVHTTHRQKLKLWLSANNIEDVSVAFFTNKVKNEKWLADITMVHWEDVKAHKLSKGKSANIAQEEFDSIVAQGKRTSGNKVDPKKMVIFDSPVAFAAEESRVAFGRLMVVKPDVQLLLVNKGRWTAFKKAFPNAIPFDEGIKKILDDYVNGLTDAEKVYLSSNWKDRAMCARLDASKILDPEIKSAINLLDTNNLSDATTSKYEAMSRVANRWNYVGFPRFYNRSRLFEQYVLLDVYGHHSVDHFPLSHVYSYMNNCYKENLVVKK